VSICSCSAQLDALGCEPVREALQLAHRARQAFQAPDDELVALRQAALPIGQGDRGEVDWPRDVDEGFMHARCLPDDDEIDVRAPVEISARDRAEQHDGRRRGPHCM
jgi:hypothetical protein